MIFCNTIENCTGVYTLLTEKGFSATVVLRTTQPKIRKKNFTRFNFGEKRIIITTDLASRGIDTHVKVEHVILYDFPRNAIDYLHRIGRTARAGNDGYVTAFIDRRDMGLAQKIQVINR